MWHVPSVNNIKDEKIVCCEIGEEALFPGAVKHIVVDRRDDSKRREYLYFDMDFIEQCKTSLLKEYPNAEFVYPLKSKRKYFVPSPLKIYNIKYDIVICPRRRKYGKAKNWKHWHKLSEKLEKDFSIFAAGSPDSSFEINCCSAWDYDRYLDASIEAIINSKIVITTDNGLAFLSLLCGKDICLISHSDGRTAPGYRKINKRRYDRINHTNADIDIIDDSWKDGDGIINFIYKKFEK